MGKDPSPLLSPSPMARYPCPTQLPLIVTPSLPVSQSLAYWTAMKCVGGLYNEARDEEYTCGAPISPPKPEVGVMYPQSGRKSCKGKGEICSQASRTSSPSHYHAI